MPTNNVSPKDRFKIDTYIIENSVDRTQKHPYDKIAKEFNVATEYVRGRYRFLAKKGKITGTATAQTTQQPENTETPQVENWSEGYRRFKETESGTADLTFVTGKRIKTKEDAIEA